MINIGTGQDVTIRELAETIMDVVGLEGKVVFDASKPDGTMQKVLSVRRLKDQTWQAVTSLKDGIQLSYADFLETN